jgi:uncharacterized protein YggE
MLVPWLAALFVVLFAAPANGATTVEAMGEGELSLPPDQAVLSLGVTTDAPTARQALEDNARSMTAVVAALAQAGFKAPDVATRAVSVTSITEFQRQDQPRHRRLSREQHRAGEDEGSRLDRPCAGRRRPGRR